MVRGRSSLNGCSWIQIWCDLPDGMVYTGGWQFVAEQVTSLVGLLLHVTGAWGWNFELEVYECLGIVLIPISVCTHHSTTWPVSTGF